MVQHNDTVFILAPDKTLFYLKVLIFFLISPHKTYIVSTQNIYFSGDIRKLPGAQLIQSYDLALLFG